MTASAPSTPSPDGGRRINPTVRERCVGGVITCGLASVPLGIGYSMWGFYIKRSDRDWADGYVVISTVTVVIFSLFLSLLGAVVFGVPTYSLIARKAVQHRLVWLLSFGAVGGALIQGAWSSLGGHPFYPLTWTLTFASFGALSGSVFWFGADVWRPIK